MLNGYFALAVLAVAPIIALVALYLEYQNTYGMQDTGLRKHRRLIRTVTVVSLVISGLMLAVSSLSWLEGSA